MSSKSTVLIILFETIKILRKLHKTNIFGMPPKIFTLEL